MTFSVLMNSTWTGRRVFVTWTGHSFSGIASRRNIVRNYIKRHCALASVAQLVGRALSHKPKGHQFESQSGHVPELQVRSLVRGNVEGNKLMFLPHIDISLPLSLSPSLSAFPPLSLTQRGRAREDLVSRRRVLLHSYFAYDRFFLRQRNIFKDR